MLVGYTQNWRFAFRLLILPPVSKEMLSLLNRMILPLCSFFSPLSSPVIGAVSDIHVIMLQVIILVVHTFGEEGLTYTALPIRWSVRTSILHICHIHTQEMGGDVYVCTYLALLPHTQNSIII